MTEWNDQALVIRKGLFHEADLWLKLLCRHRGILTIFAFGGARSKKRFCGCLDIFNSLHCRVKSSRNGEFLNLQEAALIDGPQNLRHSWNAMGLAANCLRFVDALEIGADNATECYDLLEDMRIMLDTRAQTPAVAAFFFRLRLASEMGFRPELKFCGRCGRKIGGDAIFRADDGRMFCLDCADRSAFSSQRHAMRIPWSSLQILQLVSQKNPSQWNFPDGEDARYCARAIDGFTQYHLGLVWENGFFRHV